MVGAPPSGLSYYDLLGTVPEASPSQIRQAYRKAAKRWHPDKAHPADKALSERRFKEIAEAYEVLCDAPLRRLYDLYLRCAELGYVEVPDPDEPYGFMQVTFDDWQHFRNLFGGGGGLPSNFPGARRYEEDDPDGAAGAEEPPVSAFEWLLAGSLLFAVTWVISWRAQRRAWLTMLPPAIWQVHCEFAAPMGILLSPFFFGTVSFRDAAEWMNAALDSVADYYD